MKINRRRFLSTAAVSVGAPLASASALAQGFSVVGLAVEGRDAPLGIETVAPRLSWQLAAHRRGVRQSAYRIRVASNPDALSRADLWDSGRIASDDCLAVMYAGATLQPRQRCFWQVQVWDEKGAAVTSAMSSWEMGLKPSDWTATWLAAETEEMRGDRETGFVWMRGAEATADRTSKFRLSLDMPADGQGTLYLLANGPSTVWLDGKPVVLPAFRKAQVPWLDPAHAIPIALPRGRHVLAAAVGFTPLGSLFGRPGTEIAAFLRAALSDSGTLRFGTAGWKTATTNDSGWNNPGYDDGAWAPTIPVTDPRPHPWPPGPAILMRHSFFVTKSVMSARLYVTALGGYALHMNGEAVGDSVLEPNVSDFRKHLFYRVHDVTAMVASGENVLGVMVGDGAYASYATGAGRYAWGPPPRRLLVQLELTYADGTCAVVGTGTGWRAAIAPVVVSEIYDGETYDARLEKPGWASPGFDETGWWEAWTAPVPSPALIAQIAPPIRRQQTLAARSVKKAGDAYVFDFGQNFAGWARLKVKGPAATPITMHFAEVLKADGEVDQANLRMARATDTYILRGDADGEVFEPHFTYHGFRYVQVAGFPGEPAVAALEGIVVHSNLRSTGKLDIDSPIAEQLWHNTVWSQCSNFMGIPTDCPQRDERLGWMGDANVFWDAAAFDMDVDAFTRQFMVSVRDAQGPDGAYSDFSPATFRLPALEHGPAPGWADAGVCLPWTVWQRTGDTRIIDENWEAMGRYLAFIAAHNPDFLWRHNRGSDYGDWLALDAKQPGDPTTPKDLIGTAEWAHSAGCMAQMAAATGRTDEAAKYGALRTHIAAAFAAAFVEADGTIGNGSQTSFILALRYGLVPAKLRAAAATKLVTDIKECGMLLSTGFLGTPNSLDVLADAGHGDVVYSLLLRTAYPSWGYMVAKGATTIWERWNGDVGDVAMNSYNHYALGAVCGFIFRRLAGIAPDAPGFRKIAIRPLLDARVKRVGAVYDSVVGRIATNWKQTGSGVVGELIVPANATARVVLPTRKGQTVREGRHDITGVRGITLLQRTSRETTVEIGSGAYDFTVR
jgi:alpha-L-rhamnosidase